MNEETTGSGPGDQPVDKRGVILLGVYLVTAAVLVIGGLWREFPPCDTGGVLVTRLEPREVSTRGERFRILGEGFESGARVMVGGAPIAASVISPNEIAVDAGAHAAGTVDVLVLQGNSGAAAVPGGLIYSERPPATAAAATPPPSAASGPSAPSGPPQGNPSQGQGTGSSDTAKPQSGQIVLSISDVRPTTASIEGGDSVTITGSGFTNSLKVWFGGTPARYSRVEGTQFIVATTPRHAVGPVDVVVGHEQAVTALPAKFSFVCPSVPDRTMVLLVLLAGSLGGLVHALRSFFWYVGQRDLKWSWVAMYFLLPFTSGSLAFVFYLIIRAGLYQPQGGTSFLLVGVSALVGMFSGQAAEKLKDVATGIFTKAPTGANASPPRPPVPSIASISPKVGPAAGGTSVAITGAGFATGTSVRFGQSAATAVTVVNGTSVVATTPAGQAGTVNVEVTVPNQPAAIMNGAFTYQ